MADNSLFINIAIFLWAMKIERKKDASGRVLPLDVDGRVDVGLVVLADYITYHDVGANIRVITAWSTSPYGDSEGPARHQELWALSRIGSCMRSGPT
jgi:hypothetical protein